MNENAKEILNQVAEYIQSHDDEYAHNFWKTTKTRDKTETVEVPSRTIFGRETTKNKEVITEEEYSVGCIFFHIVKIGGGDFSKGIPNEAQRILDLPFETMLKLAYVRYWPEIYRNAFGNAAENENDTIGRAWIASNRIKFFIETDGLDIKT